MKILVTGAAVVFGLTLAGQAMAMPGECSITGYDSFACDVSVDGGGITFPLPDGQTFVFAHEAEGRGLGYIIAANAGPGDSPEELGQFAPVENRAGCWFGSRDNIEFCVVVPQ